MIFNESDKKRFWEKVDKATSPNGCWNWTAGIFLTGYGKFQHCGKTLKSHRVSWVMTNGEIPAHRSYHGLCVCHRCDNRLCCNPDHLFLGTISENMADRNRKSRQAKGLKHWNSKLTAEKILAIRADGRFQKDIAADYGIGQTNVSRIKRLELWAHV